MTSTKPRILWLDLPILHHVPDAFSLATRTVNESVGKNSGNLVFRYGAYRLIQRVQTSDFVPARFRDVSDISTGKYQLALMSCANWLAEQGSDFDRFNKIRTDAVRQIECPVLPLGLGCQSTQSDPALFEIGEHTLPFLEELAERSRFILVRDQFTRDVCERFGISNAVVAGCPSNFINSDAHFGDRLLSKAEALMEFGDWDGIPHILTEMQWPHHAALLDHYTRHFRTSPVSYVFQGESGRLAARDSELDHGVKVVLAALKERHDETPSALLERQAISTFDYFTSVDEWLSFCVRNAACIGTRIHGNMTALQSGTPALLLTHDQRTSGLSQAMKFPSLTFGADDSVPAPSEVARSFASQLSPYLQRRSELESLVLNRIGQYF